MSLCSYVSFVELFVDESVEEFEDAGFDGEEAYRYATLSFFGGMLFMWMLDKAVRGIGLTAAPQDDPGQGSLGLDEKCNAAWQCLCTALPCFSWSN